MTPQTRTYAVRESTIESGDPGGFEVYCLEYPHATGSWYATRELAEAECKALNDRELASRPLTSETPIPAVLLLLERPHVGSWALVPDDASPIMSDCIAKEGWGTYIYASPFDGWVEMQPAPTPKWVRSLTREDALKTITEDGAQLWRYSAKPTLEQDLERERRSRELKTNQTPYTERVDDVSSCLRIIDSARLRAQALEAQVGELRAALWRLVKLVGDSRIPFEEWSAYYEEAWEALR